MVRNRNKVYFGFSVDSAESQDIASTARSIEECGYHFLSCGEHLYRGPGYPGHHWALTALAIAAGATQKVRLLASAVIAPLRHPAILAKETAFLDEASGGRLILGVGIGGTSLMSSTPWASRSRSGARGPMRCWTSSADCGPRRE